MIDLQLWAFTLLANMLSWVLTVPLLAVLHRSFPEILNIIRFPPRRIGEYLLAGLFLLHSATLLFFVGITGGWMATILGMYCVIVVGALLWNSIFRIPKPVAADPVIILIGFMLFSPVILKLHSLVR